MKRRGSLVSLSTMSGMLPLAAILGVAMAVNWPTLNDYFHGDDYLAFIDLATRPTWAHLGEVITFADSNIYWRPLGEVYYLIMWSAFGLNEVAYHLASIGFFLATLVLLYVFCVQAGFGRYVAAGACAFLTLFPNHVVSVGWITNGPRIIAVMFAMASLVVLQRGIARRSGRLEALAFALFALAVLTDEILLSLAPLAALYTFAFDRDDAGWTKRLLLRAAPYAVLVIALTPVQFLATGDTPGFERLQFGSQIPQHLWALTSKLVWPTDDGVVFADITGGQWTAGAIALAAFAAVLIAGSNRLRFLVLWILLGLSPFTIWTAPFAPARYLYMSAVPLAIAVSWVVVRSLDSLRRTMPGSLVAGNVPASSVIAAAGAVIIVFLGSIGASITQERDQAFAKDTEQYRVLADGLKQAAPQVPSGARIVIYYGVWNSLPIFPEAVARTIYKDQKVVVVNVPRGQVDGEAQRRDPKDVILFYTGKGFIRSAPLVTTNSSQP